MKRLMGIPYRTIKSLGMAGLLVSAAVATEASAQTKPTNADSDSNAGLPNTTPISRPYYDPETDPHPLLHDIEAYYTSPLHWDLKDWAYFGGTLGVFAVARHYDTQVRTHFVKEGAQPTGGSPKALQDALRAVGAIVGTWVYANFTDSSAGRREAWNMVEAGGLSVIDTYALKFVGGRE